MQFAIVPGSVLQMKSVTKRMDDVFAPKVSMGSNADLVSYSRYIIERFQVSSKLPFVWSLVV